MWWPSRAREVRLTPGRAVSPCNPTEPGQQAQGDPRSRGRGQGRWEWAWEKEGAERVRAIQGAARTWQGPHSHDSARGHLAGAGTVPRQCTTPGGHSRWDALEGLADKPAGAGKAVWSVAGVAQPGARVAAGPQRSWGPAPGSDCRPVRVWERRWDPGEGGARLLRGSKRGGRGHCA